MTRTILLAAGLALSTTAAAQEFSPNHRIEALEVRTDLQLVPLPASAQSNTRIFNWDPTDEPFWIALGTALLTTTVILVGMYASDNWSPSSDSQESLHSGQAGG